MSSVFTAQYRSICTKCDDDIWPGEEAQYAAFGEVVHVNCRRERKAGPVCPQCWTELPASGICGVCDV